MASGIDLSNSPLSLLCGQEGDAYAPRVCISQKINPNKGDRVGAVRMSADASR
jgi:hypothetical protein